MAKAFQTWTVLQHGPIEKLGENIWRVEGSMPNPNIRRTMTIARLRDGRLIIHNAIALEEPFMAEIEAFGTPAVIAVPNGFHRQDAKIYQDRYPSAAVYTPRTAIKKVSQVVKVAGEYAAAPKDDTVQLSYVEGCNGAEGMLEVKSNDGTTVVFADVICNLVKKGGLVGYIMGPTGEPSVPRISRWMLIKNKSDFARQISSLARPDLKRIIATHGDMIVEQPAETLKAIAATLS